MASARPVFDPKAVLEGRTPGRSRVGLTVGTVLAVVCAVCALGADLLERLDVVVASVHSKLSMDSAAMTRRMVRAVSDGHADVLGHCFECNRTRLCAGPPVRPRRSVRIFFHSTPASVRIMVSKSTVGDARL